MSETTLSAEQIKQLQEPLDWSRVKERPGPGGGSLSYLEGHDVIDKANQIFGYGEWGYDILEVSFQTVADGFTGEVSGAYFSARVRLQVRGCMPITEEGCCPVEAAKGRIMVAEHDKARKGAVTDALKRAFRVYGEQFGNSLYDKEYLAEHRAAVRRGHGSTRNQNGTNSGNNNSGNDKVTTEQLDAIRRLATSRSINAEKLEARCRELFGASPHELNTTKARQLIEKLEAIPAKVA